LEVERNTLLVIGHLRPYAYFLTRIKSPLIKVGIIEPDGIRNGKKTNALKVKTISNSGNNPLENSTTFESFSRKKCPKSQMAPKTMVIKNKIA
jgi:hypothetical protein